MVNDSVKDTEDDFLSDVDSAAIDAIEHVRDNALKVVSAVLTKHIGKPSVLYKPVLTKTATAWKVCYGDYIAYGNTPDVAMSNFDSQWTRRGINPTA